MGQKGKAVRVGAKTTSQKKRKIVVLGGGVGAISAAFELTNQPNWQDKYSIEIYQMGWRIGGKGASGRNQDYFNRIEEHGLHVWGGFYDNAFRAMQKCYQELNRPPTAPIPTWDKAFLAQEDFFITEEAAGGAWEQWHFHLPIKAGTQPGNPTNPDQPEPPQGFLDYFMLIMNWIQQALEPHLSAPTPANDNRIPNLLDQFGRVLNDIKHTAEHLEDNIGGWLLHMILELAKKLAQAMDEAAADGMIALLDHLRDWAWDLLGSSVTTNSEIRHIWVLIDLGISMMRGILAQRLYMTPFNSINHLTFNDWLKQNGAKPITLQSPLLVALHDILFAFRDGDHSLMDIEAGTALRMNLRLLRYRGAVIYRMAAGMGDIVFAPFYEVLKKRGVKFYFFSQVQNLGLSADKTSIDTIRIAQQATVIKGASAYEPLVDVNGLPCWTSTPLYDQLKEGQVLRSQQINLEDPNSTWKPVREYTLKAGTHFDIVILGLSIGSLPATCSELITASTAWQNMVKNVKTVRTQSLQLWLHPTIKQLGWTEATPPFVGALPGTAMDTYVDMAHLIPQETWDAGVVGEIAYFTGIMSPDSSVEEALNAAKATSLTLLQNIKPLWRNASSDPKSSALDWNKLAASVQTSTIEAFYDQYFRANVAGSELYVQSVANSTQYRLPSHPSGFGRLYLAGDWTQNGANLGMVEAAVMSGMLVSQAITGSPQAISGMGDFY